MFITKSVMTKDVKTKVGWYSSEHRWKRKDLWISAENDWKSMRAQSGLQIAFFSKKHLFYIEKILWRFCVDPSINHCLQQAMLNHLWENVLQTKIKTYKLNWWQESQLNFLTSYSDTISGWKTTNFCPIFKSSRLRGFFRGNLINLKRK